MKYLQYWLIVISVIVCFACEQKMTEDEIAQIGVSPCRTSAPFIKELGFDPTRSRLSTSETGFPGVVLVQYPRNLADSASKKTYQDRSWAEFGWMGPTTTDIEGSIYTAPWPRGDAMDAPFASRNKIYKINAEDGIMTALAELSKPDSSADVVPLGVLGIYYDCHGEKLYASSVAESTKNKENGVIYVVDPEDGDVLDKLEGHDATAIFVGGITGEKRLFFGSARTSDIYSVELTKKGKFTGEARKEFSLKGLGERDNDKPVRIRFDEHGNMNIYGAAFNYGPVPTPEKDEVLYQFAYDKDKKKWITLQGR